MARHYHVAAASIALDCNAKWLDNLLSRSDIPGVARERQGVTRVLSADALLRLAVIRVLVRDLEVAASVAVALSTHLCNGVDGRHTLPSGLTIELDLARMRREIEHRLLGADVAAPRRRGRPPRRSGNQRPGSE